MAAKGYLGFYLPLFSCIIALGQSIYLDSNDEPVIGQEFTLICNSSSIEVNWYRDNRFMGWSENQYSVNKSSGCKVSTNPERYIFKHCGVKHELTIKSLNFDLDNGSVWRCQNRNNSKSSNALTIELELDIVLLQSDQQLTCLYKGVSPKTVRFLPWKHSMDNKLVREIEGYYINSTVYSLNITNSQINGGNYTCTVRNGITVEEAVYNFIPKHAPAFLHGAKHTNDLQTGDDAIFSATYLKDSSVNISWYRDRQKLENNKEITIKEESTEFGHPYNNIIKLPGIKTTLIIRSIRKSDQAYYDCFICNQASCSLATFELSIDDQDITGTSGTNTIEVIIGVVVSILVVVLLVIVGIIIIIKYRNHKASRHGENSIYESTEPTPGHVYDTLGSNQNDQGSSEYDRAIHVPTPEAEYTPIGPHHQDENPPSQPASVYYSTASGNSMDETMKEDITSEYENQKDLR